MGAATATKALSVDVAGRTTLRLVVTDGGDGNFYDHGDWANAQLTCGGGAPPPDTTPPTVTTTSPATGATGVAVAANITATFSEAMTASSISTSSVTLVVQGTTPLLAASVNYDPVSLTVTLHPSASLAAATTYLATVKGGASGVKDAAGNALALDKTWTFTTAAAADTTSYLSDLAWTQVANGWGPVEKDRSNGENLAGDGAPLTLNGVTYAKGLGTHAASEVDYAMAGACSLFTASVGVDDEISSVEASLVFQVWGDTTKLYDSGTMGAATATKALSVDVAGRTTLRLVVTDGGDGNFYDHGDWANAQLTCGGGAPPPDTTPPTVTTTSPATGATGVAVAANITATFSEAMTASSISTSSVTLVVQGTTPLLAASVNYDPVSLTVTLHPSASLAAATTYLATVKGGASGVKDAAGNALALDKTWTFTTAAAADTTSYLSDLAWTQVANGWGPVEKDRSNGENLAGDGAPLTLNGVTYAKGLGTHAASEVDYAMAGACSLFTASVGVDDEISSVEASLVFQVWGDTTKLYDSGTMGAATATKALSVDVAGRTTLRLVVTDGGDGNFYDHGDWANAQLTCGGGAPPPDTTPPTVTTTSPATGATGVAVAANITATFSEAMTASSISTSSVTLVVQGTTPLLAASVNYDPVSLTVTLHPSASLAAATTYLATVKGGASGVKDAAGNALALDKTWTFTTAAAADTTSYLSDLAWTQVANGWGPVEKDRSNGENLAGDGAPLTLNGVTYAKGLGTHAASEVDYAMAGACSLFTASVGVDDEISSVEASLVFQVWGDTTKLYDSGTMGAATATKALSVDVAGRTTLRLVVTDGGDGNFYDHGDWANAQLTCGGGAPPPDTTPPTVTTTSPATGTTGVAVAANITATFSEAMTASSISTSSVTLVVQGTTPLLAASVNYDPVSLTVTLHPSASLAAATTYLATVKGGASGVKDAAGNALALDKTWTFTTAAAADTTSYLSDLAWTQVANGWGPVEKDRSNGENLAGDGAPLTLNGVTYAKGLGTHAASEVDYAMAGACSLFTASVGVDDEISSVEASLVFQVWGDTTKLYDSGTMGAATATKALSVDVAGRTTLRLVVT